jgi:hypothetical protein
MMIRRDTISYSIRKAKHKRERRLECENALKLAEKAFAESDIQLGIESDGSNQVLEEQYYTAKSEWQSVENEYIAGAMIRSKARWVEQGEKNTKYFLGLEKRNQEKKSLKCLIDNENRLITDPKKVLNEAANFYQNLYKRKNYIDESHSALFKSEVKLDEEDRKMLDNSITIDECDRAMNEMKNNKSPGSDGLTAEFYKKFWHLLKDFFVKCLNQTFNEGTMSLDQRTGVISVIPKEGKDPRFIKNWRPITLLNVDYKILVKALANRLKLVLPELINEDQNAYVKDRLIGYNIRIVNDLIDYCRMFNYDGLLLMLDFEKAFDSLSWNFVQHTLNEFGFGPSFKKWVHILYNNILSYVTNGGCLSNKFIPERGIRQGCPISAYIFILCVELLSQKFCSNINIKGLTIGKKEFKIMQFADDTILMLKDKRSVINSLKLLELFTKCSGLKLNTGKSEAFRLGNNTSFNMNDLNLKWVDSFKYLGIWFSDNDQDMEFKNFRHRLDNMKNLLRIWKQRDLSLKGKVLILKSLAFSQIIYPLSLLKAPGWVSSEVIELFYNFLWDGKKDKISRTTIIRNIDDGGLKMPDVDSMAKALKISWLSKICNNENFGKNWTIIPREFSPEIYFADLCICNYDEKMIPITLTPFYRQCLLAMEELRYGDFEEASEIKEQTLWFNKFIKQQNSFLFIEEWYKKGVMYISDLLNRDNKFLPFEDFIDLYDLSKKDFLKYSTVIQCIPKHWRKTLKTSDDNTEGDGVPKIKIDQEWLNFDNYSNKELYNLFIKIKTDKPILSEHIWKKILNIEADELKPFFRIPYSSVRDTKIQSLQYKILNNIYVTRLRLKQWRVKDSSTCLYCNTTDDLLHHFCHCNDITIFWNTVVNTISCILNTPYQLEDKDILLGIDQNILHKKQMNYVILQGKWFIFTKKHLGLKCCALEFLPYLKNKIKTELIIHLNNKSLDKFTKIWSELYDGL